MSKIEDITLENVSFTYPGSKEKTIDNVTFSVKRGERISIVGFNGAGKTTLLKLLTLLYHPTDGTIKVNGVTFQNLDISDYWKKVGFVFQNHQTYAMSVRDNILLKPSNSNDDALVWKVLEVVGLSKKIQKTGQGLDLQVTRNFDSQGMDFSGGEKQRLSIARVLSKESDVYIFDEPSSALDAVAEDEFYHCIENIPRDKIVIMISHRLSSISYTNRVVYMENGRIVADGTHDQLMKSCPGYKKIYDLQANKFVFKEII